MLDAVSDGFADGGIEIHAAFAILANLVYEAAVFAERLAFLKDSSILFVRDVDDVAGELKVGTCFSIGIGETEEPFVFLHFISDIEFIEMDGGEIDELLSIECFLVCECAEQESAGIDEHACWHVRIDGALMFGEDDGLIFPCKGHVVLLLVEDNVFERVDCDVFRADCFIRPDGLVEFCKFFAIIEEHTENRILVLTIRHFIASCSYFTMISCDSQGKQSCSDCAKEKKDDASET